MAVPDARHSVTMACRTMAVVIWVRAGIARLVEGEAMQVGGTKGEKDAPRLGLLFGCLLLSGCMAGR